ncbi:MAG: Cobalamin import ATP-binding protein BtuD [Candidatus Methanofastidiosum methylothiophilum]|uniref:Cobalamin import ATP-binding protein BtuD n=1 Tax=Candidatus Methanofastidiosum methylothiophilum TaxID=1705564 RepID=A0A150JN25_9EURY|nr:MAG: Cobalamin import ATP-binding protein BtuD [Candidatus Methanofastidiosum methylthiophilus]KYC58607.1 MAG: Cobalamin import ATP-binding protein BtuD [Candidatus Methanofastidiosum methylthiophilus]HNW32918.1 ribosome biogenesis/translation initiation ATPase RLI [Candidatus Dojkabacteria bacterium]
MRIAVIDYDKCQPKKCNLLCLNYCPGPRMNEETIIVDEETNKPVISEVLCTGCGICIHKCPYKAISIVNLPEELSQPIHQYGPNTFRLYRLPIPKEGKVLGLIGQNGVGKTTAIRILSGELYPNMGDFSSKERKNLTSYFRGTELQGYFEKIETSNIKSSLKPQYVDKLSQVVKGNTRDLLQKVDERGVSKELINELELKDALDKDISVLSGGELQRVAVIASMSKNADIYFLDEPSSYLDIKQRLNVAKAIRNLAEQKTVVVIEHDLAILDYLSDYIHILYGQPGVYGIVSTPLGVRVGINMYLDGYIKEDNIRFRDESIKFYQKEDKTLKSRKVLLEYPSFEKTFDSFSLKTESGTLHKGEVIGIVGPNATGKSTFIKILAGVLDPDNGDKFETELKISYKPQYIKRDYEGTVRNLLSEVAKEKFFTNIYKAEILRPLDIDPIMDNSVSELSGGELQRVAIAVCLSQDADLYLFDEPSAYLDIEQRLNFSKVLRRFIGDKELMAMIVEHDLVSLDYTSDRAVVFSGKPSVLGVASQPLSLRDGMNRFLKEIGITFRREPESGRPRSNKIDSQKDREQKSSGEYYYFKA